MKVNFPELPSMSPDEMVAAILANGPITAYLQLATVNGIARKMLARAADFPAASMLLRTSDRRAFAEWIEAAHAYERATSAAMADLRTAVKKPAAK